LRRTLAGRTPGHALNEAGMAEAEALAEACAALPIAAVFASPIQRAQETAVPIAARLGLEVRTEEGINEIDFGHWRGQDFETLFKREDIQAFNKVRALAPVPGGEIMLHAQARAIASLHRLNEAFPDAELLLVSHADLIKCILAAALGMPLDFILRLEIAPASRSVLDLGADWARVVAVNLPVLPTQR
jgi:probable phosphoglycerate mutase